ncbi:MAG: beta-hydroxyacyl-ACP dehydratase [Planctomycetes bacterium]|nr:beta-hydroxyacyl-ACP dehydratase [Planctomycetota bacterium]
MAIVPLADLSRFDLAKVHAGIEEIRRFNPQRHEMEQLSAIVHFSLDEGLAIARRDVRSDEFWVRGHIPGRPVFPGVLMIEASAQLATYYYKHYFPDLVERFMVFRGADDFRFRGQVVPGDTLYMLARGASLKPRMGKFDVQGIRNGEVVFEGIILGAPT